MNQAQAYDRLLEVVGGAAALADGIGIDRNAVYAWKGVIPKKQLTAVLKLARRAQRPKKLPTRRELRPDLFTPKPCRGAGRGMSKPNGENRGKSKKEESGSSAQGQKAGGREKAKGQP